MDIYDELEDEKMLTNQELRSIVDSDDQLRNNDYLNYLINNRIIDEISRNNFLKICQFVSKKDLFEVYDYDYLNAIIRNVVLLYADIDEEKLEEYDDPEDVQKINRARDAINSYYKIIDDGDLKAFNKLVNILMGENCDTRDKIKFIIDISSNFEKYKSLIYEFIAQDEISIRDKYTMIELLRFSQEFYDYKTYKDSHYDAERDYYPDDSVFDSIQTLEDLRAFSKKHYNVRITKIRGLSDDDKHEYKQDSILMIKNEITKLLTNTRYFGDESLDTIGFTSFSLKVLRNNINNPLINEELSKYISFMNLIDSILQFEDLRKLKIIACRIAAFKQNSDVLFEIYSHTEQMVRRIKEIYAYEIQEKLFEFSSLPYGETPLYKRANGMYTAESKVIYGEDISGRKVDLIELDGIDYVSLVHVLNAYGEGGKLKDFKFPRIIGKEYICLSAIDETKIKIAAKADDDDEDHVSLLFSNFSSDQLIAESFEDLYSGGDLNSLSVTFLERENFRPIKTQIKRNKDRHTEFVLYRNSSSGESIYPSGVLVDNEQPTQSEINAAAYLNIPLVYINPTKYISKATNIQSDIGNAEPYRPVSEEYRAFKEKLLELREAIVREGQGQGKGRGR